VKKLTGDPFPLLANCLDPGFRRGDDKKAIFFTRSHKNRDFAISQKKLSAHLRNPQAGAPPIGFL
jgi:hypothetical protein